jgi:hypothetical protein
MRYHGSGHWDRMGGPAFTDISAGNGVVTAVSIAGHPYSYSGNNQRHEISGQR